MNFVRPLLEYNVFKSDMIQSKAHKIISDSASKENRKVTKIIPEENAILIGNDRKINYKALILATGITEDYDQIKGLNEALKDPNCPVFSPNYFPADDEEVLGAIATFETGDAYYYIPPFPFSGEVETYNFLFSEGIWKKDEKWGTVSPIRKLRVLNANQTFS